MDAIIYTSNTGFTKKYAELLSDLTGLECYDLKNTPENEEIKDVVYMGWLMAGKIKSLGKAFKKYNVAAVCAVGMGPYTEKVYDDLLKQNNLTADTFYLQGGFDFSRLSGIYKLMMSFVAKTIGSKLEKKERKTDEEAMYLDMIKNGCDFVCEENLREVVNFINKDKL